MDPSQKYGIYEVDMSPINWIKHVGSSLLWVPLAILEGILIVAGFVYLQYLTRTKPPVRVVESKNPNNNHGLVLTYSGKAAWLLCGNDEDGITGPYDPTHPSVREWVAKTEGWSLGKKMRSWWYRNPVANERWSKLGFDQDPDKMVWIGNSINPWECWKEDWFDHELGPTYWIWCRQGWRCGLWIVTKKRTYRIGAKVYPYIPREIEERQGLFTIQRRRNRA